jgi:hypothetical protein
MTDAESHETGQAAEALSRLIRDDPEADPEWLARALIAALKLRGWRPTLAVPSPAWKDYEGQDTGADVYARGGALARQFLESRATGPQPVLAPGDDP